MCLVKGKPAVAPYEYYHVRESEYRSMMLM